MKSNNKSVDADVWSTKFITEMWKYSLGLWTQRNQKEHGTTSATSLAERDATANVIRSFYEHIKPTVMPQDEWLFNKTERRKLNESFENQYFWIELVEKVCMKQMEDLGLVRTTYVVPTTEILGCC